LKAGLPTRTTIASQPVQRRFGQARRRGIADYVCAQGSASVDELALRFGVSTVTVRTDLEALAREGALERTHGGALAPREGEATAMPFAVRAGQRHEEKVRIARAAADMIGEGDTVLLDSGTTTAELAREILRRPPAALTVVTNAINVAAELAETPHVRVLVLGGVLQALSQSLVGPDAEAALSRLRADVCFIGADGVDADGISTCDPLEARLNQRMLEVSTRAVALADASKLDRRGLAPIAPLSALRCLITDASAARETVERYRAAGVELHLV
jgi:DeoR family transcriptional regulator of aga operon